MTNNKDYGSFPGRALSSRCSRRLARSLRAWAPVVAGVLTAGNAMADEHVMVMLDRSGSMGSPSAAGGGGMSRWEVAVELARDKVALVTAEPRVYGLWVFDGSSADELLPLGTSRQEVLDVLDGVHPSVSLGSPGGSTPLAGSICDAVDELINYEPTSWVSEIIELFSDGLENTTPESHECWGPDSVSTVPPYDVDSWEWKVTNKARTGNPNSPADPPLPLIVNVDHLFDEEPNIFSGFSSGFVAPPKLLDVARPIDIQPIEGQPIDLRLPIRRVNSPLITSLELEKAPIPQVIQQNPAIGVLLAVQFYAGLTQTTGGTYRAVNSLEVLPQLGDVTGDQCVDVEDQNAIIENFGMSVGNNHPYDINDDNVIDIFDYQNVAQNFGEGC